MNAGCRLAEVMTGMGFPLSSVVTATKGHVIPQPIDLKGFKCFSARGSNRVIAGAYHCRAHDKLGPGLCAPGPLYQDPPRWNRQVTIAFALRFDAFSTPPASRLPSNTGAADSPVPVPRTCNTAAQLDALCRVVPEQQSPPQILHRLAVGCTETLQQGTCLPGQLQECQLEEASPAGMRSDHALHAKKLSGSRRIRCHGST